MAAVIGGRIRWRQNQGDRILPHRTDLLEFDLSTELNHGIAVSNLAYAVAEEAGTARRISVISWQWPVCFMILVS